MKHCSNPQCPDLLRFGRVAEFEDHVGFCSACDEELSDGPASIKQKKSDGMWAKVAVTLIAVALTFLGKMTPTLGLSPTVLKAWGITDTSTPLNFGALGLTSVLSAYMIIEFIALLIPSWRKWRIQGAEGRQNLFPWVMVTTVFVFVIQCWAVTLHLHSYGVTLAKTAFKSPGITPYVLFYGSLAIGTFGFLALAFLVSRKGIGNGFSVLLCTFAYAEIWNQGKGMYHTFLGKGTHSPASTLMTILIVAFFTYLFWRLLRIKRYPFLSQSPFPRQPFGFPTSGINPLTDSASVLMFLTTLTAYKWLPSTWSTALAPGTWTYLISISVLIVFLGVVYSLLFYPLGHVTPWIAFPEDSEEDEVKRYNTSLRTLQWKAIGVSVVVLLGVMHISGFLQRHYFWTIGILTWLLFVAVIMDLVEEWNARQQYGKLAPIRQVFRMYTIDAAVMTLHQAEIPVLVRSQYHRTLFHFFVPYIPVELMVPEEHQVEAKELIDALYKETDRAV